jgi:diguanylate cyclase
MIEADGMKNRLEPEELAMFRDLDLTRNDVMEGSIVVDGNTVGILTVLDSTGRAYTFWSRTLAEESAVLVQRLVQRERARLMLARAASTDPLTGLANRRSFQDALHQTARLEHRTLVAVLYIDLDRFKQVNDAHGHLVGDRVLVTVAERLSGLVRANDVVTRVGGDEFCVLAAVDSAASAELLGARIAARLEAPIDVDGIRIQVGATIGIAIDAAPSDPEKMVRAADDLVIDMKRHRKHSVAVSILA